MVLLSSLIISKVFMITFAGKLFTSTIKSIYSSSCFGGFSCVDSGNSLLSKLKLILSVCHSKILQEFGGDVGYFSSQSTPFKMSAPLWRAAYSFIWSKSSPVFPQVHAIARDNPFVLVLLGNIQIDI